MNPVPGVWLSMPSSEGRAEEGERLPMGLPMTGLKT